LTVDYGSAGLIEGFPGGEPVAGDGVVAVGAALDSDGSLIAARLERYEVFRSEEGDAIEVEDLINRFVAPDDFDVSDVRVRATDGTEYEGGSAADLQLNVKIQVEGFIAPDGVLEARKIEVKDGGRVYDN